MTWKSLKSNANLTLSKVSAVSEERFPQEGGGFSVSTPTLVFKKTSVLGSSTPNVYYSK